MSDTAKVKADKPKAEEPKAPAEDAGSAVSDAPADSSAAGQAGTDQYGRQIYEVTCSSCGNKAQVPFKPSGDRPVYCRDCYMQQRQDKRGPRR